LSKKLIIWRNRTVKCNCRLESKGTGNSHNRMHDILHDDSSTIFRHMSVIFILVVILHIIRELLAKLFWDGKQSKWYGFQVSRGYYGVKKLQRSSLFKKNVVTHTHTHYVEILTRSLKAYIFFLEVTLLHLNYLCETYMPLQATLWYVSYKLTNQMQQFHKFITGHFCVTQHVSGPSTHIIRRLQLH
jgi:hypothetical protein